MIQNIKLYTILNSSGSYAIKVKLWTRAGCYHALVPLVEGDLTKVRKLKSLFSSIRTNFIGLNEEDWVSFDSMLSQINPKNKNVDPALSLALSLASARAASQNELWRIGMGKNRFPYIAGVVARGKDWMEFMLIPHRERTVLEAFNMLIEVWRVTGEELKQKGFLRGRSISGAWLSDLGDVETLYLLDQIARDWNMMLGLNIGGSYLWMEKKYNYKTVSSIIKRPLTSDEQMSLISAVIEQYKPWYVEDPFHGSDFMSHAYLSQKFDGSVIAGSELYGTDISRMKRGLKTRCTKAIAVNPKNLFTVSQLSEISEFAKKNGLLLSFSRFDRETEDGWLADLSLAFGIDMLKLGIPGTDNISKFNRLLEMWEDVPSPRMGSLSGEE